MEKVLYCETKPNANGLAVKTKLTLDLNGLTDADIREYAYDAMVIKWQSAARRNATKNGVKIPTETTYIVPKPGVRGAVTLTADKMLLQMFGLEKSLVLIEKYGTAEKAIEAVKALM